MKHDLDALAAQRRTDAIRITDAIRQDLGAATRVFWGIGNNLRRLADEKLYLALSYATLREYIAAELDIAASQAFKMMRVVRAFTQSDADKVGLERAALLITYAKAVGHGDPGELVRADATIGSTPASQASRGELSEAIRELRGAKRAKRARSQSARNAARQAKTIAQRVHALARDEHLGRAKVEVRDTEVVIRLSRASLARWSGAD